MSVRKRTFSKLALLIMLAVSIKAKAQFYVGLEAGATQNYLITNVSSLNSVELVPQQGIAVSAVVQYKLKDWLAFEATPGLIQKNYKMQRTGYYTGIYQQTKNNYLQLPISAKFYFGSKKLKGFMSLGGYAAFWSLSHVKGAMPNSLNQQAYDPTNDGVLVIGTPSKTVFDDYLPYNYNENKTFDEITDRRVELGVNAGLGVSYEPISGLCVFTEFKYSNALTSQQNKYQDGQEARYNETGSFLVGFTHKIPFHCKKKVSK